MLNKLAIHGVGLIGGSFARACRLFGVVDEIVGVGRSRQNIQTALDLGIIDSAETSIVAAARDADLVFLAGPVGSIVPAVKELCSDPSALKPGAIVTDAASVKEKIVAQAASMMPAGRHFVGGHPIAGTEHSGSAASFATLYAGRKCILTPLEKTDPAALDTVAKVWKRIGSQIITMNPAEHDRLLALVSHLPHIAAYALVNELAAGDKSGKAAGFAAGGFRDITRIASSNPEMWVEITSANRDNVVSAMDTYISRLTVMRDALKNADERTLLGEFASAKNFRDSLPGSPAEPKKTGKPKSRLIVAIDGPAGVGKSTLAKNLADRLGTIYIDSGAMYRSVALAALDTGVDVEDEQKVSAIAREIDVRLERNNDGTLRVTLNGDDVSRKIREDRVNNAVSQVSRYAGVRSAMTLLQQSYAKKTGVVMEGRDVGTVVFPDADYKFFLLADESARVSRRLGENKLKGIGSSEEGVREIIRRRDKMDSARDLAPLAVAPGAIVVDTTHLTVDEVLINVLNRIA